MYSLIRQTVQRAARGEGGSFTPSKKPPQKLSESISEQGDPRGPVGDLQTFQQRLTWLTDVVKEVVKQLEQNAVELTGVEFKWYADEPPPLGLTLALEADVPHTLVPTLTALENREVKVDVHRAEKRVVISTPNT